MNFNQWTGVGRVTKDPQLKSTPNGMSVCSFSIATNQSWVGKNGQKQEKTEYHNLVAWGKLGETIAKWVTKGQEILVTGRLETRTWDKDGIKHYATEIICDNFSFGQKAKGQSQEGVQEHPQEQGMPLEEEAAQGLPTVELDGEIKEGDLPF